MPQCAQQGREWHSPRPRPSVSPPNHRSFSSSTMSASTGVDQTTKAARRALPAAAVAAMAEAGQEDLDSIVSTTGPTRKSPQTRSVCVGPKHPPMPPRTGWEGVATELQDEVHRPQRDTDSVYDSGSSQDTRMDPNVVETVAVLERRLHKAITANSKWQEKYSVEAKANKELGRRVRSWKTAHEQEVHKRKDVERRMLEFEKAAGAQAKSYRQEIRRLATLLLRGPAGSAMLATIGNHRGEGGEKAIAVPVQRSSPPGRGKRPPGRFRQDTALQGQIGPEANKSDAHMSLSGCQAGTDSNGERFAARKGHGCHSTSLPARQANICVTHGNNKADTVHENGDNISEDICREGQTRTRDRGYTSRAATSGAESTRTQRKLAPGWDQVCDSFKEKSRVEKCTPESSLPNPTFTCDPSCGAGDFDAISDGSVDCGGNGSSASRRYSDVGVSRLRLALQAKTPLGSPPAAGNGWWSSPFPGQGGSEAFTTADFGTASGNRVTEDGMVTIQDEGPEKEETLAEARVGDSVLHTITRLNGVERSSNHQTEAALLSEPEGNGVEKDSATKRAKEQEETEPGVLGIEIVGGGSEDLWLEQSPGRSSTESLIDLCGGSEEGSDSNVSFSSSPGSSSWEGDAGGTGGVAGRYVRRVFTPPSSSEGTPRSPLPPLSPHILHPAEGDDDGAAATSHCTASGASEFGAKVAENTRELYPSTTAKPLTSAVVVNKSTDRRKPLRRNRGTYHSGATSRNAELGRAEICAVLGGVPRYESGCHSGCNSGGEKASLWEPEDSDGNGGSGNVLDELSDEEHQERVGGIKQRSTRRSCRPGGSSCRGNHAPTPTSRDVSDVSDLSSEGFDDREGDFSEYHRGGTGILLASNDAHDPQESEIVPVRGEPGGNARFEAWNNQPPGNDHHKDAKPESPSIDPRPCEHVNRWEDSPFTSCDASPGNVDAQQQPTSDLQQQQQQEHQHQELIPRITELFRATVTSTSSSDISSGGTGMSLECARDGPEGEEEASLATSLGSNDTADMFAGMQVSAASSMELSESGSPRTVHSFSLEDQACGRFAVCDEQRCHADDGPEAAHLVRPQGEKTDCARAGGDERGGMPDDGGTRLFESLLSVGVPAHWDLNSFTQGNASDRSASTGGTATVQAQAARRSRVNGERSTGSWIRSVFYGGRAAKTGTPTTAPLTAISSSNAQRQGRSTTGQGVIRNGRPRNSAAEEEPVGEGERAGDGSESGGVVPHSSMKGRLAPQVLAQYPPGAPLPCENVADYCFPQGVNVAPIDTRTSQSSINKVLFQPGACQRGSQSFVFMFSGDHGFRGGGEAQRHRTYGVCVTYPKVLRSAVDTTANVVAISSEEQSVDSSGQGVEGRRSPRRHGGGGGKCKGGRSDTQVWGCYCLLSRLPFFDLHFQVLWDLLAAERVMRMQMMAKRRGRPTLAEEVAETTLLACRVKELLESVSQRYMRLAVPAPGQSVRFTVHPDLPEMCYQRGVNAEFHGKHQIDTPGTATFVSYDSFAGLRGSAIPPHVADGREMVDAVAAWAIPGTLSSIPLDVMLAAVGALMCECQVVVVSENLGRLSSVVLALAALTCPLLWMHPLVPVMPMDMGEVLSAPVPYLIGTPRLERSADDCQVQMQLNAGQVLLDADEKTVVFASAEDASRTKLPRSRALLARLEPLTKILSDNCGSIERGIPVQLASGSQAAASEVVRATVSAHVSTICAGALRHYDRILSTPAVASTNKTASGVSNKGDACAADVAESITEKRAFGSLGHVHRTDMMSELSDAASVVSTSLVASDRRSDGQINERTRIGRQGCINVDMAEEDSDGGEWWDVEEGDENECEEDGHGDGQRSWGAGAGESRIRAVDVPFLRQLVHSQAFEVYRAAAQGADPGIE